MHNHIHYPAYAHSYLHSLSHICTPTYTFIHAFPYTQLNTVIHTHFSTHIHTCTDHSNEWVQCLRFFRTFLESVETFVIFSSVDTCPLSAAEQDCPSAPSDTDRSLDWELCYFLCPVSCVEDTDFPDILEANWGPVGGFSLVGWIFMTRFIDSQKLMSSLHFPVWLPVFCQLKFTLCKLATSLHPFLLSGCFHAMPISYEITFWMSHLLFFIWSCLKKCKSSKYGVSLAPDSSGSPSFDIALETEGESRVLALYYQKWMYFWTF